MLSLKPVLIALLLCDAPCIVEIQYEPLPNSMFVSFHIRMHALPGAQYESLLKKRLRGGALPETSSTGKSLYWYVRTY